jgi:ring-1,2-phenylacetyl-CoA epoxidase subunit PaaD
MAAQTPAPPAAGERVRALLSALTDPEIPVLTLEDLGIIRWIRTGDDGVTVGLAPTYTGCPALEVIEANVIDCLRANGYAQVAIERVLAPPWTTDWISEAGRRKLREHGIAPPRRLRSTDGAVPCPRCAGDDTVKVSEFGSTPCKAAWKCNACLEPFEYFKCL